MALSEIELSPLHLACRDGFEATARKLILDGANVNACIGQTGLFLYETGCPLHMAAENGHKAIVQLLLNNGADVNLLGGRYGSALQAASAKGHADIVALLLDNCAPTETNESTLSALQLASKTGHAFIVKRLLEAGANVDARNVKNDAAIQLASVNGHEEVVALLLRYNPKLDTQILLMQMAEGRNNSMLLFWRDHLKGNVELSHISSALPIAAIYGNTEVVETLLAWTADWTGLRYGNMGRMATGALGGLFLDRTTATQIHTHFVDALTKAAEVGHTSIVMRLLGQTTVTVSDNGLSMALEYAASYGHSVIVMLLLDEAGRIATRHYPALGRSVSRLQRENIGMALQNASKAGHTIIVKLLLDRAITSLSNEHFGIALQEAAEAGHTIIVMLLLDQASYPVSNRYLGSLLVAARAFVDTTTVTISREHLGEALKKTAKSGHTEVFRLLLNRVIGIVDGDCFGAALEDAAEVGHEDIVQILLYHDNVLKFGSKRLNAAVSKACRAGHESMTQLLLNYGADLKTGDEVEAAGWARDYRDGPETISRESTASLDRPTSVDLGIFQKPSSARQEELSSSPEGLRRNKTPESEAEDDAFGAACKTFAERIQRPIISVNEDEVFWKQVKYEFQKLCADSGSRQNSCICFLEDLGKLEAHRLGDDVDPDMGSNSDSMDRSFERGVKELRPTIRKAFDAVLADPALSKSVQGNFRELQADSQMRQSSALAFLDALGSVEEADSQSQLSGKHDSPATEEAEAKDEGNGEADHGEDDAQGDAEGGVGDDGEGDAGDDGEGDAGDDGTPESFAQQPSLPQNRNVGVFHWNALGRYPLPRRENILESWHTVMLAVYNCCKPGFGAFGFNISSEGVLTAIRYALHRTDYRALFRETDRSLRLPALTVDNIPDLQLEALENALFDTSRFCGAGDFLTSVTYNSDGYGAITLFERFHDGAQPEYIRLVAAMQAVPKVILRDVSNVKKINKTKLCMPHDRIWEATVQHQYDSIIKKGKPSKPSLVVGKLDVAEGLKKSVPLRKVLSIDGDGPYFDFSATVPQMLAILHHQTEVLENISTSAVEAKSGAERRSVILVKPPNTHGHSGKYPRIVVLAPSMSAWAREVIYWS